MKVKRKVARCDAVLLDQGFVHSYLYVLCGLLTGLITPSAIHHRTFTHLDLFTCTQQGVPPLENTRVRVCLATVDTPDPKRQEKNNTLH